jgi:hypothetical protein
MNGLTGGRLKGNGSLGTSFADGPFSPGHDGPGRLTAALVFLDLDNSLVVKLGGTNAGIDYDQLVAKETFELVDPSAALKVQMLPGFVGAVGNQYTIVRLDGTKAVGILLVPPGNTNGFNGLGEGSVLTLTNGAAFRISYQGGDGNDVVLPQIVARPILNPPSLLANGTVLIATRRAGMLSVGLLSGGNGEDELIRAGAFRVFRDTPDLHNYLDELGVLP